jgi:hypothetical protein
MLKRYVLHLLAEATGAGDDGLEALEAGIRGVDPLLRSAVRKQLQAAVVESASLGPALGTEASLRLAYLIAERGPERAPPPDEQAILAAFTEARSARRPAPPPRRWWALLGTVATVLTLVAALSLRSFLNRPFDPRRAPLGRSLAVALPAYVVLIDRARNHPEARSVVLEARAHVLSPDAQRALGPDASSRLGEALDSGAALANASGTRARDTTAAQREELKDQFFARVGAANAAMRARGTPYFIDGDVLTSSEAEGASPRTQPLLLSFYVEREVEVLAAGAPIRALHIWRLDQLNLAQAFLGYTRPRTPEALVLLDQIETELVMYVLPALPPGEGAILADADEQDDDSWQAPLHARAAQVVREHYAAPGAEGDAAARIGKLLARRRALVNKWRREIAGLGMRFRVPERLVPESDYRRDLDRLVPRSELFEWDDLHEELLSPELERAFVRMRSRYAASVERHEVQHRIDFGRGLVPIPEPLRARLGLGSGLDARPESLGARARDEMSAYLAMLAASPASSRLDLVLLSRFVFDRRAQGNAYCYAALIIIEELARQLGLPDLSPLTARGAILRSHAATRLAALVDRSPEELSAAAASLWELHYGGKLPNVTTSRTSLNTAWRH